MNCSFDHSFKNMGWRDRGSKRTGWGLSHPADVVNATHRTGRHFSRAGELDEGCQVVREIDGFTVGLVIFQCELISGGVNLSEIIDAGVRWAVSPPWSLCLCLDDEAKDKPDDENQDADFQ